MDWEKGLLGSGWQDYHDQHIQPLLDRYDGQINDILSSGAHGEIARMQAVDDALGSGSGSGNGGGDARVGFPVADTGQGPPNRTDSPGGPPNIPPLGQAAPRSASEVGNFLSRNPIILRNAEPPDTTRYSAKGTGNMVETGATLEDAARSPPFSLTDQNLADIQKQAEWPLKLQNFVREVVPSAAEKVSPPIAKPIVSGAFGILNHQLDESEPQRRAEAYQQALFRTLNGMVTQSGASQNVPAPARGFFVK